MKKLTYLELPFIVVVMVVLIVVCVRLTAVRHSLKAESLKRLNFTSYTQYMQTEGGIDIHGALITALPATVEDRGVIFLLRNSSLDADLDFWLKAAKLAKKYPTLRLVAYCDGQDCAKHLIESNQMLPFPVIAFGEPGGTVALFQNDREGKAIVRSERWFVPKSIEWRDAKSSPQLVIDGAMK